MLMDVYTIDHLDKLDDWIEKIVDSNKVMESIHMEIHKLKEQAREKILEAKKHYSDMFGHF
jgi:peroxiredoxin family protein